MIVSSEALWAPRTASSLPILTEVTVSSWLPVSVISLPETVLVDWLRDVMVGVIAASTVREKLPISSPLEFLIEMVAVVSPLAGEAAEAAVEKVRLA